MKPVLDHTKGLQSQINQFKRQTDSLTNLENPDKCTQEKSDVNYKILEQKLDDLRRIIEITLLKQMESNINQNMNFSPKFQSIERELDKTYMLGKKVDQNLEYQNNIFQKRDDNLKQILDSLAKVENIKQFQGRLDTLEQKLDKKLDNIVKSTETTLQEQVAVLLAKLNEIHKVKKERKVHVRAPLKKIGSKYYYIENTIQVNWFLAAHKCLEYGGHLASIQSSSEVSALNSHLETFTDYWIDLNDLGKEGEFLSATTGIKPSYLNFKKGEPNNVGNVEHCVIHNKNFNMNDDDCNRMKWFICEFENVS